jgi:hypothetical protein
MKDGPTLSSHKTNIKYLVPTHIGLALEFVVVQRERPVDIRYLLAVSSKLCRQISDLL